ncbi:MAG: hypothetical protein C0505_15140 [Leptothrix sp. (in: Bacteria)]|nr:hypothetical protein [Leptothrix sp. (in: b-proteobacteria)]
MNLLRPERLQALAREYALGSMQGGARRRFERLLHENASARREVVAWQERFATLAEAVPPMTPRERVWQGLEQRLGLQRAETRPTPWWQRWLAPRALGGLLVGALMATVVGTLVLQANPGWIGHETLRERLPPSYVGLLSNAAGEPAVLLSSRRQARVLTAKLLLPLAPPAGSEAVLWAYPKGGGQPFRVGTIAASTGSTRLPLADTSEKLFSSVDRLSISLEATGSTPAAPSAEPVLAGPCVKLW